MKSNITANARRITLFAAVLVAVLIFTGNANAQTTYRGTFTLQHSARWGKTVLGPGDYIVRVNLEGGSSPLIAEITYAKSGRVAARESCTNADTFKANGEKSALLARIRRDIRYKALMEIWLYLHVPLTFALLAALTAHIVSIFFL